MLIANQLKERWVRWYAMNIVILCILMWNGILKCSQKCF